MSPVAASDGALTERGAIVDDLGDHRPGQRAAAEHAVLAPLIELSLRQVLRALDDTARAGVFAPVADTCDFCAFAAKQDEHIQRLNNSLAAAFTAKAAAIPHERLEDLMALPVITLSDASTAMPFKPRSPDMLASVGDCERMNGPSSVS